MNSSTEPLLEVDLEENGGEFVFYEWEELQDFVEKENEFWDWLQEIRRNSNSGNIQRICKQQQSAFGNLKQTINKAKEADENDNNKEVENQLKKIRKKLLEVYRDETRALHSSTPRAKFIEETREEFLIPAVYALGFWIDINQLEANQPNAEKGRILATSFDLGLFDNISAEEQSLVEERDQFREQLNESKESLEEHKAEFEEQAVQFDETLKEREEEFKSLLESSQEALDNLEQTYDEELSLRKPVTYWESKATNHTYWAIGYSALLVLILIGFSFAMYRMINWLLSVQEPELFRISLVVLFAGIGVWIIRIITKNLMSHLHLKEDAKERKTIAQTYLSLLRKEEDAVTPNERELILQALFTKASTGIISDQDSGSPLSVEKLSKILQR